MPELPYVTGEAEYDEMINGDVPVLVDFTASWCGPCKQLAPVLDEMQSTFDGRVRIVKVDVDDAKAIAGRYDVQSVPTLMLFEKGELLTRIGGVKPKRELFATLEPLL